MDIKLAILPGDGIGPEVVNIALDLIRNIGTKFGHNLYCSKGDIGGAAIDKYGDPFPDVTYELCKSCDAVLFGAVGDPKYDNDPNSKVRPEQGLLKMRKSLGLFANLRPVVHYPSLSHLSVLKPEVVTGSDILFVRELTGGLYFGRPQGRSEDGTVAYDTCVYSREEIERILKVAFELAQKRKKHLTVVDKANILATSRLWREIARGLAPEYPDVSVDYLFVDNAAMQIIQTPQKFDVVVTENMFGDILTDEGSILCGSMGLLPSASIGSKVSLYEPVHGSYPQAAGKNIANPLATILSVAMMYEITFNLKDVASLIREAVDASIVAGIVTPDLAVAGQKSYSNVEVGRWICDYIICKKL